MKSLITLILSICSFYLMAEQCSTGEYLYLGQCRTACEVLEQDLNPLAVRWDSNNSISSPDFYCRGAEQSKFGCEMELVSNIIQVDNSSTLQGDFRYTGDPCSSTGEFY